MASYFGRYELRSLIGSGGMGEVYEAFDGEQNRLVALKLLPAALAADEGFVERFRRESFAAAQLTDPHVIPIHRYGDIDGRLYIDMRLVKGLDLAGVLARDGALSAVRAVSFISQAAEALDAAHAANLIHRDVKPSNLLVTTGDFVYLVDFGIAHVFGLGTTGKALTATGATIGTLDYMAPERFIGRTEVDARTDVYSLTCVLYECLTGSRPFPVDGLPALLHAHLNTPPPQASADRDDLPAALDDVIARGMAKDPEDRFHSAGELAMAAAGAIRGLSPGAESTIRGLSPGAESTVRGLSPVPRSTAPTVTTSTTPADPVPAHDTSTTRVDQPPESSPTGLPRHRATSPPTYIPTGIPPAAAALPPLPPAHAAPLAFQTAASVHGTAIPPAMPPAAIPAHRKRRTGWLIAAAALVVIALTGGVLVGRIAFGTSIAATPDQTGAQSVTPTDSAAQPSETPTHSAAKSAEAASAASAAVSVSAQSPAAPAATSVQTLVVTSFLQQTVVTTAPAEPAPSVGSGDRGSGDLGLSTPISNLSCNGQYIVFVGSAVDPGSYESEVQGLLSAYPESSYLRTGSSCSALVKTVAGNAVCAVYLGPYGSPDAACAAAGRAGGSSYVKVLGNVDPDQATVEC